MSRRNWRPDWQLMSQRMFNRINAITKWLTHKAQSTSGVRRKHLAMAALATGVFFLLGFLISSQLPRVRSLVLVEIERVSREHLPVRIMPESIKIDLAPLGVQLKGVKVLPKEELLSSLEPFSIDHVRVSISPWQLLQGKLRISNVSLAGTRVRINIPESPDEKNERPLDGLFDIVDRLPISRIALQDVQLEARLAEPRLDFQINNIDLNVSKRFDEIRAALETAVVYATDPETKAEVRLEIETELAASRDRLTVGALTIRRGASFFVASGEATGDFEALRFEEGEGSLRAELKIDSLRNWAAKTFPKKLGGLPKLNGKGFVEARVSRRGKSQETLVEASAITEGLEVEGVRLDQLKTSARYSNGQFRFPLTTIRNPAGTITLTDVTLRTLKTSLGPETKIDGRVKTAGLSLHQLFKQIGIGEIPVFLGLSADLPCSGFLQPGFSLKCDGRAQAENLLVRGSMKSQDTIVALKSLRAEGSVSIDQEKVSFDTALSMNDSTGRASGVVSYATGFSIDYQADRLAIRDIQNLAGLRLEGTTQVKGSTQGNSQSATAKMALNASNFWLENYWLGNASTNLNYQDGVLSLSDIQGYLTVSRYNADVALDFNKGEIQAQGRVPFFESRDLLKVFSRLVTLPVPLTGTGQAQIKVAGPLEFTQLSYDLKSSLFRGSIAGESFDIANFDVKAVKGEMSVERAVVTKGSSQISLTGKGHPDGTIETVLRGRGIRLEETNFIASAGFSLSGLIDFDMDIAGPVLRPNTTMRGTVSKTAIGDQAVPDSDFRLKFTSQAIEGAVGLLGNVVKADLVFPLSLDGPFRLKLNARDWNFAPLLSAISGPGSRKDYFGLLTAKIDLSSTSGGFWNASGNLLVDEFELKRGATGLANTEPIRLSMQDGRIEVDRFQLAGENGFLKISNSPTPAAKMDLQVNGKVDLGLIAILVPFFEELRGVVSFTVNTRGGDVPTSLLGSAYLERGFLKFFEFPHAFENLKADVVFSQRKILFNKVSSDFAGGRLEAGGNLDIVGYKKYPINVNGTFDKVTLNVPQGVSTSGSGTLTLSGDWFPLQLQGSYQIESGLVTMKIGGDSSESSGIRREFYLPEILLEESFSPLDLALDIEFARGIEVKSEIPDGRIDGKVVGQLAVRGDPTKPSLLGTITAAKDTKVTFRDTEFEVANANVQFTDPTNIAPKLFISARSRVQSYDVSLMVQGSGSKPEISLTSVPPLVEKDIISLLALGVTDSDLDKRITSENQASNVGLQAGAGAMKNNPISKGIKERLGLDVQFSPGFDDTNASVQKIIISRQFSPNLGVSASQSFGKDKETEARVRLRLNEKLSLVGSWQGRDYTETDDITQTEKNPNKVGLDVEYKFEFK